MDYLRHLSELTLADTPLVGNALVLLAEAERKSAELEINSAPTQVLTTTAYRLFLDANKLIPIIKSEWKNYLKAPESERHRCAIRLRSRLRRAELPSSLTHELSDIKSSSGLLITATIVGSPDQLMPITVNPEPSAGMFNRTQLNQIIKNFWLSLFSDAALYEWARTDTDPAQLSVALSFQPIALEAKGINGVLTTTDLQSGNPALTSISTSPGISPSKKSLNHKASADQYVLFTAGVEQGHEGVIQSRVTKKALLTTAELIMLTKWGTALKKHYGFDISFAWSSDGTGKGFYIRQITPPSYQKPVANTIKTYHFVDLPPVKEELVSGIGYGESIATGRAVIIKTAKQLAQIVPGDIVVARQILPHWKPLLRHISALVVEDTIDALSRELARAWDIPVVIGATKARRLIRSGSALTVSTINPARGQVYQGRWSFHTEEHVISQKISTQVRLYLDTTPFESAAKLASLPVAGSNFTPIISIQTKTETTQSLAEQIALSASAFFPRPLLVNIPPTSFSAEGRTRVATAIKQVRDQWGLVNIGIIMPSAGSAAETTARIIKMAALGLAVGTNNLAVYLSAAGTEHLDQIKEVTEPISGWSVNLSALPNPLSELTKKAICAAIRLVHARRHKINISVGSLAPQSELLHLLIQEKVDQITIAPVAWFRLCNEILSLESKFGRLAPLRLWTATGRFQHLPERALSTLGIIGFSVSLTGYTCQTVNQSSSNAELQATMQAQLTALKTELKQEISDQLAHQQDVSESTYREDGLAHFSLQYPTRWQISHQTDSVSFEAPDGQGKFKVVLTSLPKVSPATTAKSTWQGFEVTREELALVGGAPSETIMTIHASSTGKNQPALILSGDAAHFDTFLSNLSNLTFKEETVKK